MTNLRRQFKRKLSTKEDRLQLLPGVAGDGLGNLTDSSGRIYVRIGGQVQVLNATNIQPRYEQPVWVGYEPAQPGVFKILNERVTGGSTVNSNGPARHANTHEWMGPGSGGGSDVVKIQSQQIMPLRVMPYSGYQVVIWPGLVRAGGNIVLIGDLNSFGKPVPKVVDLSSYAYGVHSGKAKFVLITLDTTGAEVVTGGSEVDLADLALTDIPTAPTGTMYVLAAVRLWFGQDAITENRETVDIVDLRWPMVHNHDATEVLDIDWNDIQNLPFLVSDNRDIFPYKVQIASNGESYMGFQHTMQSAIVSGGEKTFIFYLGDDYDEWCVVYHHNTGVWDTPIEVADGHTADDNHNYASVIIDQSGYIHIAYGCHNSPLYYKKSISPYSIEAFSNETSIATNAAYPKLILDSDNALYVFYRKNIDGSDSGRYFDYVKSLDSGVTWSSENVVVDSGDDSIRVYAGVIGIGTDDSIHVIWTWRDSDLSGDSNEFYDVVYAKTLDGGTTWKKSSGVDYVLPISPATGEVVAAGSYFQAQHIALDVENNPHLVYVVSDADGYFAKNHIHYCYLLGGVWQDITLDGSDYTLSTHILIDGSIFYIFSNQMIGSFREVIMFQSVDGGTTWKKYQLTSGSTVDNNNLALKLSSQNDIEIVWTQGGNLWYMNDEYFKVLQLINFENQFIESVVISDPQEGDILTLEGSSWVNKQPVGAGKYRQFTYVVSAGDFSFVIDENGNPIMALQEIE